MSDNTFTLRIELGNDAMQDADDVSETLLRVAMRIQHGGPESGAIKDENGNTVGQWGFSTELVQYDPR